ncbi:MAG: MMPL family transporter, partial [Myxococcota bacterium]|nr:MMPL family transporter [Myxococcota bacterium]
MKQGLDRFLADGIAAWVDGAARRSGWVIGLCGAITLFAGFYAATELGVNSDNVQMVAEDLPSRRNHEAFARLFPNLENALLVVIDAETPELAREAASRLAARLRADPEYVEDAYVPGGGDFFETHGLLYRGVDELDVFADQMSRMQPILAALEQDPSIASLASLIQTGLERAAGSGADSGVAPGDWGAILESVGNATVAVYTEFPLALSWEELLLRGSDVEVSRRRIVVVHPVLDFESFLTAGRIMDRIREHAGELGLDSRRGLSLRITGNPALNYEEVLGLAWDLGLGGVVCFFFVAGVLTRALRTLKLVVAALATLLVGLVWSAATAAAVVGHLNLVSAAFGILFIGLGVDFGIHLGMAYASRVRGGLGHDRALHEAGASVGGSLLVCTLTTAIGFFVFAPTDYLGVAELGLIAGYGMFIIFFLTLTLFPALLSRWLRVESPGDVAGELHFRSTWWRFSQTHPGGVLAVALAIFAAGLALLPRARFDLNVIEMRAATTESVQ